MVSKRKAIFRGMAVASGVSLSSMAFAQTDTTSSDSQFGDIVVTAQKREQNLQKVPVSVSAIGGQALQDRGINNLTDLGSSVPGLQIQSNSGVVLPFLRGVGNPATTLGNESSVAVYLDGVYFARLQAGFFALSDIERIEVLKGPQGTLFGRNATGGVIQIVTKQPSHTASVQGSIGYGRFDTVQGSLYASMGLSDTVAMDVSVAGHTDDGFGRNVTTGHRTQYEDSLLVRSKLLFEPSETTRFTLSGLYAWSKLSGQGGAYPGTTQGTFSAPFEVFDPVASGFSYYDQRSDVDQRHITNTMSVTLKADQELAFADLTSITAYIHETEVGYFDADYGPRPDFAAYTKPRVNQFTQELQISSLKGSPINWIVGLYYYHNDSLYRTFQFLTPTGALASQFGPGLDNRAWQKAQSLAGFAQVSYEIVPKLTLTGGIRYSRDKVSADGYLEALLTPRVTVLDLPGASQKTNRVTYRIAADYQLAEHVMAYASFSTGYKSANFNLVTYNPVSNRPETIDAYEAGLKGDYFDRRLRLNIAGFHYKIGSPQVLLFSPGGGFISNAGGSRVNGFEFDGQLAIADGLTTRFGATYLDSKYTEYLGAPSSPPVVGGAGSASIDASGNRTPLASKWAVNIGADFHFPTGLGEVTLTADYSFRSSFYWEPDNFLKQGHYGLLDGQIKIAAADNVAVRIWGRNLTDEKYAVTALSQAGPGGYAYNPGRPRSYGMAVDFNF
jgi:iron complex outermembrane receptor protein